MSNLLILFPNFIVLGIKALTMGGIFSYFHFLFPGSALLGIILQEKRNLVITSKLMFMLISSYSYLFGIHCFKMMMNKNKNKNKEITNEVLNFMLNIHHSTDLNKYHGIVMKNTQIKKFERICK